MPRFAGLCIVTPDVSRLRTFYQDVFEISAEGDDTFCSFSAQGTLLSIFTESGMESMAPGSMQQSGTGRCVLEFQVEDVDQEYQRLVQLHVSIVKSPTTQPWGLRSVWFRDPDGNIINFFCRVSSAKEIPKPAATEA